MLVDKQGRVAGRVLGEVDRTQLREVLTELANEPSREFTSVTNPGLLASRLVGQLGQNFS